jgi:hypothetical protein
MKPIWQIDSRDVEGLQGRDDDFAQFVNDLLAGQARAGGVPTGALRLNLKTQAPDGGVDAIVTQAIPADRDPEGYCGVPTCWQYKASPTRNIKPSKKKKGGHEAALREEIRKPEAAKLVAAGYGYRFCIADDMPPPQLAQWEAWLLDEAQRVVANPSPPQVVTAYRLASWGTRLPGIILPFRPFLGPFQSLRTWGKEITSQTPHFVPVAAWQPAMQVVRGHAGLSQSCVRVVQAVHGEAGVGKTRCVYESLVAGGENQALVVYSTNEVEAERIADILANDSRFCGIIVADECSVESRVRLERRLQPHANRVRVIAIDNRQQEEPTGTGEIRLERMEEGEVEQVLERQFPGLPLDRLRAFAELSGRFIRLALELCAQSDLIPPAGHLGPVLNFFRDQYLSARLREEERKVVEAVALVPRVGFKGDVRQQLEWLCEAVGLQTDHVVETAARLKQAPGFVALGERYLYVTPRLIAQAAFQSAWARWIRPDPERFFLDRFRGELLDGFADQVRAYGTPEMRQVFVDFFQNWTGHVRTSDLADEATVRRLVRLVEVEPQMLLPRLRRLIEAAGIEELRQVHARYSGQAARRELVWLAEKCLRLPDHFADAERILLRLALAETEAYANNASGVWKELFRPLLSGTPIPFPARLRLLEQRFQTNDASQRTLCLGALHGPLTADRPSGRVLGPPVVAGRIPPSDWRPSDPGEVQECWTLTVDLIKRLARSGDAGLREGIIGATLEHLAALLRNGFLPDVIEIIGPDPLPDARLAELLQALDQFLELYGSPDAKHLPAEVETAVRDWRLRLVPESLHGRLVSIVGQQPWHLWGQSDDHAESVLADLARDLLSDRAALDRELPWLCSREAYSAPRLGVALGQLDAGATQLDRILDAAAHSRYPGIARGYIQGLVQQHPEQSSRVNERLDRLQASDPRAVFDITTGGPEAVRPLERLLAMVDASQLPVEFLRGVEYGMGNRPLELVELRQVIDRLTAAARQGNGAAARAAAHVLWMELRRPGRPPGPDLRSDPRLRALLETVLRVTLPVAGQEAHAWSGLLQDFGNFDPEAAIGLAVRALADDDLSLAKQVQTHLVAVSPRHPEAVLQKFGEALLDPATGWRLTVRRLHDLVQVLPADGVKRWLDRHGRPAAVALARHLPPPHVEVSGNAVVPELTAYVLERFEDDERVFREFCGGVHSGQTYWGDMAAQYEREGEVARRFLDHPLRRIRDWAQYEIDQAAREAARWRARDEEMAAP